jgi:hypothetical protein
VVEGKAVRVVRGARHSARVDLRRLPKGRFTVRIRVTTVSGRTLTDVRRHRTCTPRPRA